MGEFVGTILEFPNVDTNIIRRMTLIFNVESKRLDFSDCFSKLILVIPKEDSIVNLYHEDDVTAKEDAVVY